MDNDSSAHHDDRTRSRAWLLASAVALVPYLLLVARFDWVCDDAFISFRYSRHLSEGLGLVFNAGEQPPVEGYSNLLWVLLLAPFEVLGFDLVATARVLTVASGAALLVLVARTAQNALGLGFAGTLACSLLFASLPTVSVWSTSGLETLPFALLVFLLFERLLASERAAPRVHLGAGLAAALVVLMRADGALWAAAVVGLVALVPGSAPFRVRCRTAITVGAWTVATALLQLAWRLSYHAEWVSNTAYAKAGFSTLRLERGVDYVVSLLLILPILALLPLLAVALRGIVRPGLPLRCALLIAFALAWALYVGGDFMAMGRLVAPAMAFLALSLGCTLKALSVAPLAAGGVALGSLGLALLPSFDLHPTPRSWRAAFHFRWSSPEPVSEYRQWRTMVQRTERWERIARALALHTRPGESIVFGAVGAVGYRTELTLLDPLGLVSPAVARREVAPERASPGHDRRVEPTWFLDRRPDYLDAFVVPRGTPLHAGIRPKWRREAWFDRMEVVRRELPEGRGFPPDSELRLLRLDWSE